MQTKQNKTKQKINKTRPTETATQPKQTKEKKKKDEKTGRSTDREASQDEVHKAAPANSNQTQGSLWGWCIPRPLPDD